MTSTARDRYRWPRRRRAGRSSDRAVAEGRVELRRVDSGAGTEESLGRILERARVGRYRLLLTTDSVRQMYWVVVDGPSTVRTIGYVTARWADCRHAWRALAAAPSERRVDEIVGQLGRLPP